MAGRKKPGGSKALDRPFDRDVLAQAEKIARTYRLTFEPDPELGFRGSSIEMPLVWADGKSLEACAKETLFALSGAVALMLEKGQRPPAPASAGKREEQVNIRLTTDERLQIEEWARCEGFRSTSDYMRHAALRGLR